MKAILVKQFGGPEVLQVAEVPVPEPRHDDVLVRVVAAGVNPVDTYIRSGSYQRLPALPYCPGIDGAGIVESAGPGAGSLSPGDRVYLSGTRSGTCAEFAVCAASEVHPLPDGLSFAQGAAIGIPYATAFRALFHRGRAEPGETLLIHGATGGVGLAAVQLALSAGLRVHATGGTAAGRRLVSGQGEVRVFDHTDPACLEQLLAATGDRGFDLVIEMLANVNLAHDLQLLAPRGRIVVVGSRGTVEINPRDAMVREASIHGMILANAPPGELASIHRELAAGFASRTLRPVAERSFPLAEAPRAHALVMEPGARGKIVLLP